MAPTGHVSLVGAGPGDPGLLTRRAIARLRSADLVLYDALVDVRVLHYARRAQKFFVGKRAGRHALSQQGIHALMIRAARKGRRVVRLKGGDPFVFGRGGEEAIALREAGVSFDVVPGISSAIAAPAAAGIPVTHRELSSAFLVVTGHDEGAFAAIVAGVRPGHVTLVVLMGLSRRASIARRLIDLGWARRTPAAVVTNATTSGQRVWRGTLDELEAIGQMTVTEQEIAQDIQIGGLAAGTIVIGEVVSLAGARGSGVGAGGGAPATVIEAVPAPPRVREGVWGAEPPQLRNETRQQCR